MRASLQPFANTVKTGIFPIEDSRAYGEAFELRNVTDY
jgi:hypothetical protein